MYKEWVLYKMHKSTKGNSERKFDNHGQMGELQYPTNPPIPYMSDSSSSHGLEEEEDEEYHDQSQDRDEEEEEDQDQGTPIQLDDEIILSDKEDEAGMAVRLEATATDQAATTTPKKTKGGSKGSTKGAMQVDQVAASANQVWSHFFVD
jgi:hypothetical protein